MVVPVGMDEALGRSPPVSTGDANGTCPVDSRAGETCARVDSLPRSRYGPRCPLPVCPGVPRGNVHGPFKQPGRNLGCKKKKKLATTKVQFLQFLFKRDKLLQTEGALISRRVESNE